MGATANFSVDARPARPPDDGHEPGTRRQEQQGATAEEHRVTTGLGKLARGVTGAASDG